MLLAADYDLIKLLYIQNILAILGGALVGYFAMGFLVGFVVRGPSGQGVSGWMVWALRILGALVCASLVALFLLGPGGAGWFGGSGTGTDNKDSTTPSNNKDEKPPVKDKEPVQPPEKDKTTPSDRSLFVEVLMNDEIKQALVEAAASEEAIRERRYYRVRGSQATALLTLKDVREKLQGDKPPYRMLYIVLGKDRSDKDVPRVKDLKAEADRLRIFADYTAP